MYSKILLDNPSAHPGLKFEEYASALKNVIELSDPQFSVGIFGGWGSGKTTLMHAIERQLNDKIVSVWFNAWRYEKEEHLIIPLLDTLRDALFAWATPEDGRPIDPLLRDRAIKAASTITKAAKAIFAGLAITAKFPLIEVSLDANKTVAEWRQGDAEADRKDAESPQSAYHASFKALQESLTEFTEHGKQRIVVFIDDLDRCLPANALQVLESMKLFFDLEGFVFVVGLDQRVIEASINWNYRSSESPGTSSAGPPINGASYIKKLFQVPFNLPSVSSGQLDDYLDAILSNSGERDSEQVELLRRVRPHLDNFIDGSEVNPREVKRFINSYILQKLIQPDLDDDVTLLLQTIAFRLDWSAAYEVFRSRPEAFIDAAKRQLGGESDALRDLDPRLAQLPESFFQYISSKGGQKLLTLDSPQLAEQVSTFEVTRDPEEPLARIQEHLAALAREIDRFDPIDISSSVKASDFFRSKIREIDENLNQVFLELRQGGGGSSRYKQMVDSLMEAMKQLKDESDRLAFALRRGDSIGPEEFDDVLKRRSSLVELIREAMTILEVLAIERLSVDPRSR